MAGARLARLAARDPQLCWLLCICPMGKLAWSRCRTTFGDANPRSPSERDFGYLTQKAGGRAPRAASTGGALPPPTIGAGAPNFAGAKFCWRLPRGDLALKGRLRSMSET